MIRFVAVIALLVLGCGRDPLGLEGPFRNSIPNPAAEFSEITGLELPQDAELVVAEDTHGGFHGDGELYFVYRVSPATIDQWLAGAPPWGQDAWRQGPVPGEISGHCLDAPTDGMNGWLIRYAAEDSQYSGIPWHNGRLLVLDPQSGQVILSCWDF